MGAGGRRGARARAARLVCVAAGALGAAGAFAQWQDWDYDRDRPKERWTEAAVQLPPYPRPERLVEFEAGAASPHRFFLDPDSLAVGEDGVVRYVLVVRTAGGALNVSFEGIRCEAREHKLYAVGRSDGSWAPARDPQWRRIESRAETRPHAVLYGEILCRGRDPVGNAREALDAISFGRR